jgi:hypothetical protein
MINYKYLTCESISLVISNFISFLRHLCQSGGKHLNDFLMLKQENRPI